METPRDLVERAVELVKAKVNGKFTGSISRQLGLEARQGQLTGVKPDIEEEVTQ